MEEDRRKHSLWALLLTLLLTVGTLALLLRFTLRYEQLPDRPDLTQLAQDSILFGGDYVMLGNTLDNLQNDLMLDMGDLVIIELKRDGQVFSPVLEMLHQLHIHPHGFSKYCMGSALTCQHLLPVNRFKTKLIEVRKLVG